MNNVCKIAVPILIILIQVNSIYAQSYNEKHWKEFYGPECVVLDLKIIYTNYSECCASVDDFDDKMEFRNSEECTRYFDYNYGHFPFDNDWTDFKGELQIKHKCVPCGQVYGELKTAKASPVSNSKSRNYQTLENAKDCFSGNENVYNDFKSSLGNIRDGILLSNITCSNGKIEYSWYKEDENDNKTSVPENERGSIDNLYLSLQNKAEERKMHEYIRQLNNAQTAEEAADLLQKLDGIFTDLKKDKSSVSAKSETKTEIPGSKIDGLNNVTTNQSNNETVLDIDTDGDGKPDMQSITVPGKAPVYREIPVNKKNEPTELDYSKPFSRIADIAKSLSMESAEDLNKFKYGAKGLYAAERLVSFIQNPNEDDNFSKMYSALVSVIPIKPVGFMYSRGANEIPKTFMATTAAALEQVSSVLDGKDPDESKIWEPIVNYLGSGLKIDNLGGRITDFKTQGDIPWSELTNQYGWIEGTKRAMLNYLLDDFYKKYPTDNTNDE